MIIDEIFSTSDHRNGATKLLPKENNDLLNNHNSAEIIHNNNLKSKPETNVTKSLLADINKTKFTNLINPAFPKKRKFKELQTSYGESEITSQIVDFKRMKFHSNISKSDNSKEKFQNKENNCTTNNCDLKDAHKFSYQHNNLLKQNILKENKLTATAVCKIKIEPYTSKIIDSEKLNHNSTFMKEKNLTLKSDKLEKINKKSYEITNTIDDPKIHQSVNFILIIKIDKKKSMDELLRKKNSNIPF